MTLRLECRQANSCPLPGPCTALIGGQSWRGLLGDTGCTWSERGTRLWALFPVSLCPQQDADTPSPAPAGTAYLSWGPLTGAWSSGTLAPSSTCHTPGQPRASAPAGLPACPPRPTAGPNPLVLRGAPSSRKPSRGAQQGLLLVGSWQPPCLSHPQPGFPASCPRALRQRLGQGIPLERIMGAAGSVTPALCQPVTLQDRLQPGGRSARHSSSVGCPLAEGGAHPTPAPGNGLHVRRGQARVPGSPQPPASCLQLTKH